jgi:hypothetical protein
MAQKVGARLGRGEVLQRTLSAEQGRPLAVTHEQAKAPETPCCGAPPVGRDEAGMGVSIEACSELVVQGDLHEPGGDPIEG